MSSPWSTGNRSSSPLLGGSPYGMSPVQLNSSCPEASYLTSDAEAILAEELSTPFVERTTSNIDCAVCQEHFQDGENVRRLPCNHQFHTACVDPWLQMHARCPLCNSQMPGTVPMPPRNLNPTFSSTTASAAARQRPPRERYQTHPTPFECCSLVQCDFLTPWFLFFSLSLWSIIHFPGYFRTTELADVRKEWLNAMPI
jgi:hypothetical protein